VRSISDCFDRGLIPGNKIAGGKAIPIACSAEDGEVIVKAALNAFGGIHILIANAGILRDRAFVGMTEHEWDDVFAVHLR
jgi:multifunctional beta-oxidation protein